jgi:hypothetical protein
VWNRISYKLKKKRVRNDPDMWIRADRVCSTRFSRPMSRTCCTAKSYWL